MNVTNLQNIENELWRTLELIEANIRQVSSDEEHAILLNAKAVTLTALQKYEK
jgi:hypothetical protein